MSARNLVLLLLWGASTPAPGQTNGGAPEVSIPRTSHDEFAVVEGDILLPLQPAASKNSRAALVAQTPFAAQPWGQGIVPYVFDPGVANREAVLAAMRKWESLVAVQFSARTAETDYVRIRTGSCSAQIGMVGGVQSMYADCRAGEMVHELGHTLGLLHENTRHDAGRWLDIPFARLPLNRVTSWYPMQRAADSGPYDYASIMHYPLQDDFLGRPGVTTIPRGIPILYDAVTGQPSRGDVEALLRYYQLPISVYTVTTHPAGLPVVVDGVNCESPCSFDWPAGTIHSVQAPEQAGEGVLRYTFAHWSDGGARIHRVAATSDVTLFIANMRVHQQLDVASEDLARGSVELKGALIAGFVPWTEEAVLSASSSPGFRFLRWADSAGAVYGTNPLHIVVKPDTPAFFRAEFTSEPTVLFDSDPSGMTVIVDGVRGSTPYRASWAPGSLHTVSAVLSIESPNGYRQRFAGWSDGVSDPWREVEADANGLSLTARYVTEYRLVVTGGPLGFLRPYLPSDRTPSQVTIDPPSTDGYYAAGSQIRVRFESGAGLDFVGWDGTISSGEPELAVRLDMPYLIGLDARPSLEIWPGTIFDAASGIPWDTRPIAPGQILRIVGTGLGPASGISALMLQAGVQPLELGGTQVFFDGEPAPMLYSSNRELLVEVPVTARAGGNMQAVVAYQGVAGAPSGPGPVAAVAPTVYQASGSPPFPAVAWNEDGSENSSTRPALPGSTLAVMINGLGAPSDSPPALAVFVGGYRAEVVALQMAPAMPGTVKLAVIRLPEWLEGDAHTLAVVMNGVVSASPATVAIRRSAQASFPGN